MMHLALIVNLLIVVATILTLSMGIMLLYVAIKPKDYELFKRFYNLRYKLALIRFIINIILICFCIIINEPMLLFVMILITISTVIMDIIIYIIKLLIIGR